MSTPAGYLSVVAEPDINRRSRLKTAAQAITTFKRMEQVSTLHELQSKISNTSNVDVIFISSEFGEPAITQIVGQILKARPDAGIAFVVIMRGMDEEKTLAKLMLCGIHGFLCEPYSVERLKEITELVTKVKDDAALKRRKAAAAMLVQTITRELDKICLYLSRGFPIERAKKKFADTCAALKQFQDEASLAMYCDVAAEIFDRSLPAAPTEYKGASKRVKDKMEAQLKAQFEKEMAELGEDPSKLS